MKVLLKRFCPKGYPIEQITLSDLQQKVTEEVLDKLPTEKQLHNSDVGILYQHHDKSGRLVILENGLILFKYQTEYFNHKGRLVKANRSTVFPVSRINFTYNSCMNGSQTCISQSEYLGMTFYNVLLMYALIRVQHNVDSKEGSLIGIHLELEEWSDILSAPDFADELVSNMSKDYEQVKAILNTLTESQKEALYPYIWDELTQEQIANKLGISRSSVQSRLDGVKKKLSKFQNLKELL